MAKKDELEFDDFELDEFDFDETQFDEANLLKDDRKPAVIIATEAFDQFASRLGNPNLIARQLDESLPAGYHKLIDAKDYLGDAIDETREAMQPGVRSIKSMLRKNRTIAQKFLPKGVYDRLQDWASGDTYRSEDIDPRAAEIQATNSGVFEAYMAKFLSDKQEHEETQVVEAERHERSTDIYNRIRQGIDRLVAFNDDALIKVKQKEIEIAYRQLYALTDLLQITREKAEVDKAQLATISKNTALPETNKIKLSENLGQNLRERAVGTVGDFFSNYTGKFKKNIISSVAGKFNDTMSSVQDGLEMLPFGEDDGMGMDPKSFLYSLGGEAIGSKAFELLIDKVLRPQLEKEVAKGNDSKFALLGGKLDYNLTSPEETIRYFLNNYQEKEGWKGTFLNPIVEFLKENQPGYNRGGRLQQNLIKDADEAVHLSRKMERAIVEVIPGFLERQLHVLTQIKDGPNAERIVYNPYEGRFTTAEQRQKRVKTAVDDPNLRERIARSTHEIIDILRGDTELSAKQRQALGDYLIQQRSLNKEMDIRTLAKKFTHESLSKEEITFVRDMLKARFMDGDNIKDNVQVYNQGVKYKKALEDMTQQLPNFLPMVQKLQSAGYLEDLIETGIVKDNQIDYASLLGRIMQDHQQGARDGASETTVEVLPNRHGGQSDLSGPTVQNARGDLSQTEKADGHVTKGYRRNRKGHRGRKPSAVQQQLTPLIQPQEEVSSEATEPRVLSMPWAQDAAGITGAIQQFKAANHADLTAIHRLIQSINDRTMVTPIQQATTTPVSLPETAFEGTHQRLDTLIKVVTDCCTKGVQEEQRDILLQLLMAQSGQLGEELTNSAALRKLADTVWRKSRTAGQKVSGMLATYYSNVFKAGRWVIDKAKSPLGAIKDFGIKQAKKGWDWAIGKKNQMEVYMRGVVGPVLLEHKMRAGHYIDEITGKVITKFEDIKGPVRDQFENIMVITADQLDKIYTGDGRTVVGKVIDFVGSYYRNLWEFAGTGFKLAKKVANFARKLVDPIVDIYVEGETLPRLTALLLNRGYYRSSVTGKVIQRARDIDGPVKDIQGNVVLSAEDLRKPLVDKDGKPFKTISEAILEKGRWALTLPGKAFQLAKDTAGKIAGGIGDLVKGVGNRIRARGPEGILINRADNQILILQDIRDIINQWSGINLSYREPISEADSLTAVTGPKGPGLIKSLWNKLKERKPSSVSEIGDKIKDKSGELWDSVRSKGEKGYETVRDKFRNIKETWREYEIPSSPTDTPDKDKPSEGAPPAPAAPLKDRLKGSFSRFKERLQERADEARSNLEARKAAKAQQHIAQPEGTPEKPGQKSLLGWIGTGISKVASAASDMRQKAKAKLDERLKKPAERPEDTESPQLTLPLDDPNTATKEGEEDPEAVRHGELMEKQSAMVESLDAIEEHTRTRAEEENPNSLLGRLKALREKRKAKKGGRLVEAAEPEDFTSKTKANTFLTALFGPVAGMLGDVAGSLKEVAIGAAAILGSKGLLGKLAGLLGMGGGDGGTDLPDLDPGRRGGRGGRPAGRGGMLRTVGRGLWGLTKGVAKAGWGVAKFGARALFGTGKLAFTAARFAAPLLLKGAGAIIGALGAPVVIGAAVVGGLGYLAYRWITSYSPQELDVLRFMQYGIDIHDKEARGPVLQLEEFLLDRVKEGRESSRLDLDEEDYGKILEMFGLSQESDASDIENFTRWFQQRFKPVFLSHHKAWKTSGSSEDFDELDDSDIDQKLHILHAVRGIGEPILNVPNYPYNPAESAKYGYQDCLRFADTLQEKFDQDGKKDKKYQDRKARYEERQRQLTQTPIDQPATATEIDPIASPASTNPALDTMPTSFLTDDDRALIHQQMMAITTGSQFRRQQQYEIELARLENERRQAYMDEFGITEAQARAAGKLPRDSIAQRRSRTATAIIDPSLLSTAYRPNTPVETTPATPATTASVPGITPTSAPHPLPAQPVIDSRPAQAQQIETVREEAPRPTTLEQEPVATLPPPVQVNRIIEHEALPPNATDIQMAQRQAEAREQLKQQKAIESVLHQSLAVQKEMAASLSTIKEAVTLWSEQQGQSLEEQTAMSAMMEDKGFLSSLFGNNEPNKPPLVARPPFKHNIRSTRP